MEPRTNLPTRSHSLPLAEGDGPTLSRYPALPSPVAARLARMSDHECSYLPGRVASHRGLWAEGMDADVYERFMDAAFRRSGKVIYQPVCRGCRECQSIRVPVATFRPSKSQRRCWRRNEDLVVHEVDPKPTEEKFQLYRRYLAQWHAKKEGDDAESFVSFLYDSPVQTREFEYRDAAGRLLAVGICDLGPRSLSSVYFYFDPAEQARGLGTYGALRELEFAQLHSIPYYYLGYWVRGCESMQYKASFRPNELLHPDGVWRAREPE